MFLVVLVALKRYCTCGTVGRPTVGLSGTGVRNIGIMPIANAHMSIFHAHSPCCTKTEKNSQTDSDHPYWTSEATIMARHSAFIMHPETKMVSAVNAHTCH